MPATLGIKKSGPRAINEIANEIEDEYDNIGVEAADALGSLKLLDSVHDVVYDTTGREVVRRFLAASKGWREAAGRRLRDELLDQIRRA